MSSNYERIYDVALLDDLHNFFPSLLYQPASFRTVQDVLGYVRERTSQRFNLFDYGRRQFERNHTSVLFPSSASYFASQQQRMPEEVISVDFTASLLPLLQSLRQGRTGTGSGTGIGIDPTTTYDDVVVSASQTMVDEASTEETLERDLEANCAICQDRMRQGELVRKLNICEHTFHKSCIDIWLLHRSVRCPTCRHDIREPALPPPTSPLPVAASARGQANRTATTAELVNLIFGGSVSP